MLVILLHMNRMDQLPSFFAYVHVIFHTDVEPIKVFGLELDKIPPCGAGATKMLLAPP